MNFSKLKISLECVEYLQLKGLHCQKLNCHKYNLGLQKRWLQPEIAFKSLAAPL